MIDQAATMRSAAGKRRIFGLGVLAALALLVLAVVVGAFTAAAERRRAEAWYLHTFDVLLATGALEAAVHQAQRGGQAYLLTGDRSHLAPL